MSDTSVAGTDTLVFLAEGEPGWDFPSGEFFIGRRVAKLNKQAFDAKLAKDLWERSERMIAPTYFRAANVGGCQYVDGGVWANNPVMAAIVEAAAWLRVPLNRIDVLSVGTTTDVFSGSATLSSGLFGWLWRARIISLLMHAQAEGAVELASPLLANVRLLRLDKQVPPGEVSLDGVDGIPLLVDHGREVARQVTTVQQVKTRFLNGVRASDWQRFT